MPDATNINRIIPRNLTAQAAYNVIGNPPTTRLESGVGNCYPGLEYDHRNLDRRFFPGLVVDFSSQEDATTPDDALRGARIMAVDPTDNALGNPPVEYADLAKALTLQLTKLGNAPAGPVTNHWFLVSATQGGKTITFVDEKKVFLDGLIVWRLVRSLRPGPVELTIQARVPSGSVAPAAVVLHGWRRTFTDATTGVIDLTYQPGELTQSLCSPWTHDFRDCACTYWASNHPDIVFPTVPDGVPTQPSGLPADPAFEIRMDWLRDPNTASLTAASLPARQDNRPFEISYFQINEQWQDLHFVLEGREIDDRYTPRRRSQDLAVPFASPELLYARIVELAGFEHLLGLMYLYAMFTVIDGDEAAAITKRTRRWPTLADDVAFTRSVLMEVATGEMQHLRWANHLLWGLAEHAGLPYHPAIIPPASVLPAPPGQPKVPAELTPLTPATLQLFVDFERSSAQIDGLYSQVTATLRQPSYPRNLYQLASNIAQDGESHFLHFRDVQRLLKTYGPTAPVYLRDVTLADPADPEVAAALNSYHDITALLVTGYQLGDRQNQKDLADARTQMFDLQARAEALAKQGRGIPFLASEP